MKRAFIYMICLLTHCFALGQSDFKGKIIDAETKQPIPFVNIGVISKGVGTVSDENGIFHMPFSKEDFSNSDEIQISALGYKTITIAINDVVLAYNTYPEIFMNPTTTELAEVVVSNKGAFVIKDNIGYRNSDLSTYGYWKDNIALGGELATKVLAKKGIRKLKMFNFKVLNNPSDSLLLRVNIYDNDRAGLPGTNLNKSGSNIYCVVKKTGGEVFVDLDDYKIYVNDDFYVSLELLKVYGDEDLGLILAASNDYNGSFRKYASQDKWEKISDLNMAYFLDSELLVSEKVAKRKKIKSERRKRRRGAFSGITLIRGKFIPEVTVANERTGETVKTDAFGRFAIKANKNDVVTFFKEGIEPLSLKVKENTPTTVHLGNTFE